MPSLDIRPVFDENVHRLFLHGLSITTSQYVKRNKNSEELCVLYTEQKALFFTIQKLLRTLSQYHYTTHCVFTDNDDISGTSLLFK